MESNYKIGVITPSSNTTLEPILYEMLRGTGITVHFSRFSVKGLSLRKRDLEQFEIEKMLVPVKLLSDAHVNLIAWFGTSGGWLGFDKDRMLCERIEKRFGIPAVTASLSALEAMSQLNVKSFSLVVPYEASLTKKIVENFEKAGYKVSNVIHLNIRDNITVGSISQDDIAKMVMNAAKDTDCILVFCTNFSVATKASTLEQKTGVPVLDSIGVTLWKCIKELKVRVNLQSYGKLLASEVL